MRRALGSAALLGLLLTGAGCAADGDSAADPAREGSSTTGSTTTAEPSPTEVPGAEDATDVVLLHATAAGGTVGPLQPVTTDDELSALTDELTSEPFAEEVRRAVQKARGAAGETEQVLAGVVSLGCEVPEAVTLEPGPDGVTASPQLPKAGTQRQCLAPVTTVAVATVPAEG